MDLSIPFDLLAYYPAFPLKGSYPIHLYANLARTIDLTRTVTISPQQPLNSQSTATDFVILSFVIPAGGLRYLTIHLDFVEKGLKGFSSDNATTYLQSFRLSSAISVAEIPRIMEAYYAAGSW